MAIIQLTICDLCEPEAREEAEPVEIGLDGRNGVLDLCHVHRAQMGEALGVYLAAARRASGAPRRARRGLPV
jgi:hypothetical protein